LAVAEPVFVGKFVIMCGCVPWFEWSDGAATECGWIRWDRSSALL